VSNEVDLHVYNEPADFEILLSEDDIIKEHTCIHQFINNSLYNTNFN